MEDGGHAASFIFPSGTAAVEKVCAQRSRLYFASFSIFSLSILFFCCQKNIITGGLVHL